MCIAIFSSGTYAYRMRDVLARGGIEAEIISAPLTISAGQCSTALRFSSDLINTVIRMSAEQKCPVSAVYQEIKNGSGVIYKLMYGTAQQ